MKIQIGIGSMDMEEIAALCGGQLVGSGTAAAICTDSREATDEKTLFWVTVGERVDAHAYMKRAYDGGCRLFLCQRIPEELAGCDLCAVVVADTVAAMGKLAKGYTARLTRPTVGVTGSVGKTTTKELISAVLSERFRVHKTKANHNSTIGLPMSMLEATDDHTLSVVEMGMSGFGEIDFMSRIAEPSVACITNIGSSHLELLGTRENICRAKLEIVNGMREDGVLILNGDEPLLRQMCPANVKTQFITLDGAEADIQVSNIVYDEKGTCFDITIDGVCHREIRLSVIGRPFVWAAAFAIAVARRFDMDMDTIRRGLCHFENAAMRQSITTCGSITFIEDCYNASPESVRAAVDVMQTLASPSGSRMTALLGDMRELGEGSADFHRSVGEYYVQKGGEILFTVGSLAENIAKGASGAGLKSDNIVSMSEYETDEAVAAMGDRICGALRKGDILLVKASRAIGAERILAYVKQKVFEQTKGQ